MSAPSFAELQAARDRYLARLSIAQSAIVDLYDQPWTRTYAADMVRQADIEGQNYFGMLARSVELPVKHGSTLDEIEAHLRWMADNPKESDWRADRADERRKLLSGG